MKTLQIDLDTFDFVEREYVKGKIVRNKCGRDFLYYALHYYFPLKFNKNTNCPIEIDKNRIFGFPVHAVFAWSMIQFYKVPVLCKELNLDLSINRKKIRNFFDFIIAIISPNGRSAEDAIIEVEKGIDEGSVVGIDIAYGLFGLVDHVMFIYGYDEEFLYTFDTHIVKGLEYEKITDDNRYIMKIHKDIMKKRWTHFGRVWIINKI